MFRLPGALKMPGLALKHVLKRTMRGLLPDETLRKRKGGFNVPMSAWLKQQLRPLVDEYLSPARVRRDGFFRPETTSRLVVEHMTGRADYRRNLAPGGRSGPDHRDRHDRRRRWQLGAPAPRVPGLGARRHPQLAPRALGRGPCAGLPLRLPLRR